MIAINFISILISIILCHGKKTNKIIGGVTTQIQDFPYVVTIQHNNHHICTGNLITSLHVLITASCVVTDDGAFLSNIKIIAGTNDKLNRLNNGQIRNVKYIIYHEEYNSQQLWNNDLAILKLEKPVIFNNFIKKINILKYFETFNNYLIVHFDTAGWNNLRDTDYLQTIQLKKIDKNSCLKLFRINFINLYQYCAKTMWSNQAINVGDSGSPLVINNKLFGIISAATTLEGQTTIYTELWAYSYWIKNMIENY